MEVVQEVLKNGSAHGARAAIRADQKSYSLIQLIASALDVHNILCSKNVRQFFILCMFAWDWQLDDYQDVSILISFFKSECNSI
jgi:hypothetical protein